MRAAARQSLVPARKRVRVGKLRPLFSGTPWHPAPGSISHDVALLQRKGARACGGRCSHCAEAPQIQAKLGIGEPNYLYEGEADRVADEVMRMSGPSVQRLPLEEEGPHQARRQFSPTVQREDGPEEDNGESLDVGSITAQSNPILQTQLVEEEIEEQEDQTIPFYSSSGQQQVDPEEEEDRVITGSAVEMSMKQMEPGSRLGSTGTDSRPLASRLAEADILAMRGTGEPLPTYARSYFEPRFGHGLGSVRIHRGTRAERAARHVNARAFTTGNDLYFGEGQYQPSSPEGRRPLAHELVHHLQQGGKGQILRRSPACKCSPSGRDPTSGK